MKVKSRTKKEKVAIAKKLRDFMKEVIRDESKGHEIYWDNVFQRVVWILED